MEPISELSDFDRGMLLSHREDLLTYSRLSERLVQMHRRYESMCRFSGWLLGVIAVLLALLIWSVAT